MSSLTSRSAVLVAAGLSKYAVLLLSPVLLVRILNVEAYGQYREFVLYAMLLVTVLSFGVSGSLLYFIPKDPANEKLFCVQSLLLLFVTARIAGNRTSRFKGGFSPTRFRTAMNTIPTCNGCRKAL